MTYKDYVANYHFSSSIDGTQILEEVFLRKDAFYHNSKGLTEISMEVLFEVDPRATLYVLLGALTCDLRFASEELHHVLVEAFEDAIDFENGGLTPSGHEKYTRHCGWLRAQVGAHRNWVQFRKIMHDPEAVKAWPKGTIAYLGGPRPTITTTTYCVPTLEWRPRA